MDYIQFIHKIKQWSRVKPFFRGHSLVSSITIPPPPPSPHALLLTHFIPIISTIYVSSCFACQQAEKDFVNRALCFYMFCKKKNYVLRNESTHVWWGEHKCVIVRVMILYAYT